MRILLNDRPIELEGISPTVQTLLEQENIRPQGVAVAVNDQVIRKSQWGLSILNPNDKVTIIKVAFGG